MLDKTCLSYWFPIVWNVGLPVPRTTMVLMSEDAQRDANRIFDNEAPGKDFDQFVDLIRTTATQFGYPFFLRTGHTSGKHSWNRTCFVGSAKAVPSHILNLVEHSYLAGIVGLPIDVWAVREMLPTIPLGVCPRYGDMPICREFRFFVDGGSVKCYHPYWPLEALEEGGASSAAADGRRIFDEVSVGDSKSLEDIAKRAGEAVGGSWSVDILETEKGWYLIDMAEADKSFHWPECPLAKG